jgi:hypothetical protein
VAAEHLRIFPQAGKMFHENKVVHGKRTARHNGNKIDFLDEQGNLKKQIASLSKLATGTRVLKGIFYLSR